MDIREHIEKSIRVSHIQLETLLLRFQDLKPNIVTLKLSKKRTKKPKIFNGDLEKSFTAIWSNYCHEISDNNLSKPLDIIENKIDNLACKKTRPTLIPPLIECIGKYKCTFLMLRMN